MLHRFVFLTLLVSGVALQTVQKNSLLKVQKKQEPPQEDKSTALKAKVDEHENQPRETVHVIQIGDLKSVKKYGNWIETVRNFAEANGYPYNVHILPPGHDKDEKDKKWYHRQKPKVLNETLYSIPEGDMLFFLDLDVAVDGKAFARKTKKWSSKFAFHFDKAEELELSDKTVVEQVEKERSEMTTEQVSEMNRELLLKVLGGSLDMTLFGRKMQCDFMGQDGQHTLNSGALAFRNSPKGRKIANLYAERMLDSMMYDQMALQSAVMHLALPSYNNECDKKGAGDANDCYDSKMKKAGYPRNHRSFQEYCILDRTQHLSMHDDDQQYKDGDILYHGKDGGMAAMMKRSWGNFKAKN